MVVRGRKIVHAFVLMDGREKGSDGLEERRMEAKRR